MRRRKRKKQWKHKLFSLFPFTASREKINKTMSCFSKWTTTTRTTPHSILNFFSCLSQMGFSHLKQIQIQTSKIEKGKTITKKGIPNEVARRWMKVAFKLWHFRVLSMEISCVHVGGQKFWHLHKKWFMAECWFHGDRCVRTVASHRSGVLLLWWLTFWCWLCYKALTEAVCCWFFAGVIVYTLKKKGMFQ